MMMMMGYLTGAAPNFVSSMAYEDFVFFFFRETSEEYMNCGKVSVDSHGFSFLNQYCGDF